MRMGFRDGFRGGSWLAGAVACVGLAAGAWASEVEREPAEGATIQAAQPEPAPGGTAAGEAAGWVERASITTAVVDREPQDTVESLGNDHVEIYFFTELRGLEGQTVTHRWEKDGEVVAEVPMEIGGPRWRTYSRKQLAPDSLGTWKASVVDASGRVLESRTFTYSESAVAESEKTPTRATEAVPAAPAP